MVTDTMANQHHGSWRGEAMAMIQFFIPQKLPSIINWFQCLVIGTDTFKISKIAINFHFQILQRIHVSVYKCLDLIFQLSIILCKLNLQQKAHIILDMCHLTPCSVPLVCVLLEVCIWREKRGIQCWWGRGWGRPVSVSSMCVLVSSRCCPSYLAATGSHRRGKMILIN